MDFAAILVNLLPRYVLSLRSKLALLTLALPFSPSVTIAESGPWSSGSLQIMQLAFPSITD